MFLVLIQTLLLHQFQSIATKELVIEKPLELTNALNSPIYLNEFAVYIPKGSEVADLVAEKHGFKNLGQVRFYLLIVLLMLTNFHVFFIFFQIGSLKNYFLFEHSHVHKRSVSESTVHNTLLTDEAEVKQII